MISFLNHEFVLADNNNTWQTKGGKIQLALGIPCLAYYISTET